MLNLNGVWKLYPIECGKNVHSPEDLSNFESIPCTVPGEWTIDTKRFYTHYLCGTPAFDCETYKEWNGNFKEIVKS